MREASYRHRELGDQISEILDNIRKGYDKRVRPNYGGKFFATSFKRGAFSSVSKFALLYCCGFSLGADRFLYVFTLRIALQCRNVDSFELWKVFTLGIFLFL